MAEDIIRGFEAREANRVLIADTTAMWKQFIQYRVLVDSYKRDSLFQSQKLEMKDNAIAEQWEMIEERDNVIKKNKRSKVLMVSIIVIETILLLLK